MWSDEAQTPSHCWPLCWTNHSDRSLTVLRDKIDAYRDCHVRSRKVFIIGTGRSGTHFLAQTLERHREINASIEDRYVFQRMRQLAVDTSLRDKLYPGLVRRIRIRHALCAPNHYLDKSHPAIWLTEELSQSFPRALFIGIQREAHATVMSMLKHSGILRWQANWRQYPLPNRFLGITKELKEDYDSLSPAEQCALRWRSHAVRMEQVQGQLEDRFIRVEYEDLITSTTRELSRLQSFLGLESPIPVPAVDSAPLEKWKHELDADEWSAIDRVINAGST